MTRVPNRSIRKMRRAELVSEAHRLGVKNPQRYNVEELRLVIGARIAKGAI